MFNSVWYSIFPLFNCHHIEITIVVFLCSFIIIYLFVFFMLSEEENETLFVIYSVGDGIILSHDPNKFQNEAQDINSVIFKMNGPKV